MEKESNAFSQKDLRIQKTHKALTEALMALLNRRNFNGITVNDLCTEALISRSTFYAHFDDKYDLLRYLLNGIRRSIIKDVDKYDELEREVNQFIEANKKMIGNILTEASSETLTLVREFMSSIVELTVRRKVSNEANPNHIILFNFFIGGLVNQLAWMVENNFPPEIKMIDRYLYKMLKFLMIWDAEQEKKENGIDY